MSHAARLSFRRPFAALLVGAVTLAAAWGLVTLAVGSPDASAATAPARGYWLGASDGGIFGFGEARFFGSTGAITLNKPIVGMAASPTGNGYWLVASDGGIFNFGDASFFGSTGAITLNKPIVGMAASPTGKGYWLVASDGGIFGFGDAKFFGSTGAITLNKPIVGMAASPTGNGYWLVASDGGIFNFGDASFFGSTGAITLNKPIVGMAASPTGKGYWLVASDGGIFGFGDAKFFGSTGAITLNKPIVGMAASPTGNGYWLVASDGGIFNFGDASFFGSTGAIKLNRPIVGMAAAPALPVADTTVPMVTVNQAAAQVDPTNTAPVNFTVVFSEVVSGFTSSDVSFGGTAGGTKTAVVTGGGTTYNVAVSGMTTSGTVTVSVPAGAAIDGGGNPSTASTSTDNSVTFDQVAPTVTANQAAAQADPTNSSPVNFTVIFSEPVTGFAAADVTVGGTAGGTKTPVVTGSGATYNVAVSGMTTPGTVTLSVPAGAASDAAGNASAASTSTDNTVTWDATAPTVTVDQAAAQADPTNSSPVNFTVIFSEATTNFVDADITVGGTAGGTKTAAVTGSGTTYNVAVSGMTTPGTVTATLAASVATDAVGNGNAASTSTDNTVTWDATAPTVTVDQAAAQPDPTNSSPINFTVVFSEAVTGFAAADVTVGGTAGGTKTPVVTGSGTTYNVAVSGMTTNGTVIASVGAASATDSTGNANTASTSTDNTVTWDIVAPTVTVDQAAAQADPTNASPVNFTVIFSEATTNFVDADVTVGGTAGGTKAAVVTGSGTTYNVAVSGMTTPGTVIATVAAGVATDAAGNGNTASTSTDNTVTWDATAPTVTVDQAAAQADPTNASPVNFTVVFSEATTNFADADVSVGGTAGGTKTAVVTGSGTTYNMAVSGMTTPGTVIATVAAGVATDAAGNGNAASTSADNTVNFDATAPAVAHVTSTTANGLYASGAVIPVSVVFSEPVVVTGTPTLTLETGATDAVAGYTSGSGTATLTFTYTVGAGENSADLDYASTSALALAGGTIRDAAANNAVLTLPTPGTVGSLGANKNIVIDTTAPVFESIAATMASTTVTASFSEPVLCTTVSPGDFLATVAGAPADVTGASCAGTSATTVDLTLDTAPLGGGNVAVSLVDTSGSVTDAAGNAAAPATRNTAATTDVTVTIDQAVSQPDPTNSAPVHFTVIFSEAVTGFGNADISVGGTAGGTKTATVTGSGATYDVAVNGMTTSGTVTASIPAGAAGDTGGNTSAASTSTDNVVTWDVVAPTVTVNQAVGQADPTNTDPVHFTVVFSEPVTDFVDGDVTVSGSAGGAKTATITGSGTTYDVAVSSITTNGTVIASVAAGVAADAAGNTNVASGSTDNTVTWDVTGPTVTLEQASSQVDPTNSAPVHFTVVFSEPVTGFVDADVTTGGTAGGTTSATVTGSGTTYDVAVGGMTTDGTVTAALMAGVAADAASNTNGASTSTDNTVTWDVTAPSVTVEQAAGQSDPANAGSINFTVVFSEPVANFVNADVTIDGTAGGTKSAAVTGTGTTYNVAVTGMTTPGTVTVSLVAGVATDAAGNGNGASTSTDNSVDWDATAPTVTVNQAAGQNDPTNASPVNYTVVFSEPVSDFVDADVTLGGTAGGTKAATVTGTGTTYTVAVTGMTTPGTVIVSVPAGVARDAANNTNTASTSADNSVTYDAVAPAFTHVEATTGIATLVAVFSEPLLCSSVSAADFLAAISGSPTAVVSASCTGTSDSTIDVVLSSAVAEGEAVTLTTKANAVTDPATNPSGAKVDRTPASMVVAGTADGASVPLGGATYTATATDTDTGGTIATLVVLLDGAAPGMNDPVCTGTGTSTATCTYDATLLEPLPGAHTFTFIATDDQGNVTTTIRTVTVTAI